MLANKLPFPENCPDIAKKSESLVDDEYKYLLNRALEIRTDGLSINPDEAFDNIGLQMDIEANAKQQLNSL